MPDPPAEITTIRQLVDRLLEIASTLPEGTDTRFEFGVCDAKDLQLVDDCDLDTWSMVSARKSETAPGHFVLLRGHVHPGEKAGRLLRGAASHADQELRDLTDDG